MAGAWDTVVACMEGLIFIFDILRDIDGWSIILYRFEIGSKKLEYGCAFPGSSVADHHNDVFSFDQSFCLESTFD